jgi:hypothetical protein
MKGELKKLALGQEKHLTLEHLVRYSLICARNYRVPNMDSEEKATDDWYENLEIYSVLLTITETGKIVGQISCGDNYWEDHTIDIETEDKKLVQ